MDENTGVVKSKGGVMATYAVRVNSGEKVKVWMLGG